MAVRKILGFLNSRFNESVLKNAETQVTMFDPDRASACLDHLYKCNDVIREVYEAYDGTLRYGESKLKVTFDILNRIAAEIEHFESMITSLSERLKRDEDILEERNRQLKKAQENVDATRKRLEVHKMAAEFKVQEGQDLAYQRALATQRMIDLRRDRFLLEFQIKHTNRETENMMESFDETQEKCERLQLMRIGYRTDEENSLRELITAWEGRRERRDTLQVIAQGENIHEMLQKLLAVPVIQQAIPHTQREMAVVNMRSNRQMIEEQITDQEDQRDFLQMRNEQLENKIRSHEEKLEELQVVKRLSVWNPLDSDSDNQSNDDLKGALNLPEQTYRRRTGASNISLD